jgi:flagellum-specific peptidoglycan hydrolase FlgJ
MSRNIISKLFFYEDGSLAWTKVSAFEAFLIVILLFVDYWYFGIVNEVILNWSVKIIPVLVLIRPAQKIFDKRKHSGKRQRGLFPKLFYHEDNTFSWTKFAGMFGNVMVMMLFFDYYINDRVVEIVLEWSVAIIPVLVGLHPAQMGLQGLAKSGLSAITQRLSKSPEQADPTSIAQPEPEAPTKEPITLQEKFVAKAYPEAKGASKITGIDPVFVVAQAAVESGWGKSGIGTNGNNIFGIKAGRSWQGKKALVTTSEYLSDKDRDFPEVISVKWSSSRGKYHYRVKDYFRDYDTLQQAFEDHAKILQQPHFSHAWAHRSDGRRFAKEIQSGKLKYATSDRYTDTITKVMDQVEKIVKDFSL